MKKILLITFVIIWPNLVIAAPEFHIIKKPSSAWNETLARNFVKLSIDCVDRDSPHMWERYTPGISSKQKHPIFWGCYDWHSAVHGHWAMLRVLREFPSLPEKQEIEQLLEKHFQPKFIEGEIKFFKDRSGFEQPYGHGWFLRLITELHASSSKKNKKWLTTLKPLEQYIIEDLVSYLNKINRPIRIGAHDNTAYALMHAWNYANKIKNKKLADIIKTKAENFYKKDEDCPLTYEPSSGDFLSPCFIEADLMQRILAKEEFLTWFQKFMPKEKLLKNKELFLPVEPIDKKDPILGHLIGLMFQKAASMEAVARALEKNDLRKEFLEKASVLQAARGVELMYDSGYGGSHWLASFAIFYYAKVYAD